MNTENLNSITEEIRAPESVGQQLSATRLAQGLTIEAVATQLRLTPFQINCIEKDQFDEFKAKVFARGYVSNYARLLKLPVAPLLALMSQRDVAQAFEKEEPLLREVNRQVVLGPVRWMSVTRSLLAVALLLSVGGLYHWVFNDSAPSTDPSSFNHLIHNPASITQFFSSSSNSTSSNTAVSPPSPSANASAAPNDMTAQPVVIPAPPMALETLSEQVKEEEKRISVQEPKKTVAVEPLPLVTPPIKTMTPVTHGALGAVVLRFTGQSWVEVRDASGGVIFAQLNSAGSEKNLRGQPPFSLVIGRAQDVQLTYNGKSVDLLPFTTDTVARLRLEK
jgi:cytoskeleton protein RodZ